MQLYQRFDVDIVPPARTVLKMRLRHRCVLVNFKKFFILKLWLKLDSALGVF